jgi:hypothetical protein
VTLNEPVFFQCARALALDTLREGGTSDEERLVYAFRRCLSRTPTGAELAEIRALLERRANLGADSQEQPAATDGDVAMHPPDGISRARLAAWTAVSRVLLNLDETITKE